jgi:hypothetical protein
MSQLPMSRPIGGKRSPRQQLPALTLLWLAALYFLLVPLVWPHGDLGWGHYRLRDLALGLPAAIVALWMTGVRLVPTRFDRLLQLRLIAAGLATGITLVAFDAVYLLGIAKVRRGNVWYDELNVNRTYNMLDSELGYLRKPNLQLSGFMNLTYGEALPWSNRRVRYRSDEHGFRNPTGIRQADVVCIGDSFTEACQVAEEETFARQVEANSGVRCVNLGLSGYGPQQELLVLKRFSLAYQPRLVVWQLWEGNDLEDAERFHRWKRDPDSSRQSLAERLYSQSLLVRLLKLTRAKPTVYDSDYSYLEATLRQSDGQRTRLSRDPGYVADAAARYPDGLAETRRAIAEGYRLCRARGIELLVLFIPLRPRALEPYVDYDNPDAKKRAFPIGSTHDQRDMDSQLTAFCRQLGCPAIDLLPAMRAAATRDNRRLYLARDPHLDVGGHAVVAQQVVQWLASVNGRGKKVSNNEERALADHPWRSVADLGRGEVVPGDRL